MKKNISPLNVIWLFLIVSATVVASYNGKMLDLTNASLESAKSAVELAIGLVGGMALWLGILKVVEAAGLMRLIAKAIRPLMVRLFPDVPANHPAMSAMLLNMAANALGLGNAATPMGLKAMKELDKLNLDKGTATNAMCLFLAINTSSLTLIPIDVIATRASAGVTNPADILLPTLVATTASTTVAIIAAKLLAKKNPIPTVTSAENIEDSQSDPTISNVGTDQPEQWDVDEVPESERTPPGLIGNLVFGGMIVAFVIAIFFQIEERGVAYLLTTDFFNNASNWLLPLMMCGFLLYAYFKGIKVYEAMTEGAKEGFEIAIRIIPFLVAILVAIGMFRASGALELFANFLTPVTSLIGMPAEALPMVLIRPLSGSGAFGVMADIVENPETTNTFLSYLVSTMQGSTETTFYILAVYFGSIGILRPRHAVPAALCADAAGMLASLVICRLLYAG
jgi:spore maturation protein SpmA